MTPAGAAERTHETSDAKETRHDSTVRVRFARRFREGGEQLFTVEVQSALSMPRKPFDLESGEKLVRSASLLSSIVSVFRGLAKVKSGGEVGDALGLVDALFKIGTHVFGTGTGEALGDKVEANARVGSFLDVAGALEIALARYAGR